MSSTPDGTPKRFHISIGGKQIFFEKATDKDYISNSIESVQDFYERTYLDELHTFLEPGAIVVDVGANIGNHTLYFSIMSEARVISYEPVPETAQTLRHNASINSRADFIEIREKAVGSSCSRASIESYTEENVGATKLSTNKNGPMEVVTLDSEDLPRPLRLLKIDAEGMDIDVLRGAAQIITSDRPIIGCEAGSDTAKNDLLEWCQDNSYTVYGMYNATPTYILLPSQTIEEISFVVRKQGESLQKIRDESRAIRWQLANMRMQIESLRS